MKNYTFITFSEKGDTLSIYQREIPKEEFDKVTKTFKSCITNPNLEWGLTAQESRPIKYIVVTGEHMLDFKMLINVISN